MPTVDDQAVADALRRDGYTDPLPGVRQQWADNTISWLPKGHKHILTIESLAPTVSGWQCTVVRRQVDEHGNDIGECGKGLMYLDTLLADCTLYEPCGRCKRPFDPADTRHDGAARYADSRWCRGCADRCHESTEFDHSCPVCQQAPRA